MNSALNQFQSNKQIQLMNWISSVLEFHFLIWLQNWLAELINRQLTKIDVINPSFIHAYSIAQIHKVKFAHSFQHWWAAWLMEFARIQFHKSAVSLLNQIKQTSVWFVWVNARKRKLIKRTERIVKFDGSIH